MIPIVFFVDFVRQINSIESQIANLTRYCKEQNVKQKKINVAN